MSIKLTLLKLLQGHTRKTIRKVGIVKRKKFTRLCTNIPNVH